jgi:hypothetical protein
MDVNSIQQRSRDSLLVFRHQGTRAGHLAPSSSQPERCTGFFAVP